MDRAAKEDNVETGVGIGHTNLKTLGRDRAKKWNRGEQGKKVGALVVKKLLE